MLGSVDAKRVLVVAMRPSRRGTNRYTALLSDALAAQGIVVREMPSGLRYPWSADIVLLHWPNEFFISRSPRATLVAALRLATLWMARLRRQKLVWLVHNLTPHAVAAPAPGALRRCFLKRLDGVIFLSEASRRLVIDRYRELADIPYIVTAHGVYADAAPPAAPLSGGTVRLALIGQIRPYKGAEELARFIANRAAAEVHLDIAGACSDPALQRTLEQIQAPNVGLALYRHSEEALRNVVVEADAIVLPYRDILNSGAALYGLSHGRPVIAPRLGSLMELQDEVGRDWVWLYDGALSEQTVTSFLDWLRTRNARTAPDLSRHRWDGIGPSIAGFLRGLA